MAITGCSENRSCSNGVMGVFFFFFLQGFYNSLFVKVISRAHVNILYRSSPLAPGDSTMCFMFLPVLKILCKTGLVRGYFSKHVENIASISSRRLPRTIVWLMSKLQTILWHLNATSRPRKIAYRITFPAISRNPFMRNPGRWS